jgi:hypothetical protein
MKSTAIFGLAATGSASVPLAVGGDEQGTGNPETSTSASRQPSQEAIDIGSRRELFVDDLLIGRLEGVRVMPKKGDGGLLCAAPSGPFRQKTPVPFFGLELHPPQPREIVLQFDQPWEGLYSGYETVLKDGDVFRFYYRGMPAARHTEDVEIV